MSDAEPSFTCPRCRRTTSYIAQGYCGFCHDWTRDYVLGRRAPLTPLFPLYFPPIDLDAWKHLDWTVTAAGYRLVIIGGAMIGLEPVR